jgi:HD-GYP domain-containing protein (c-di-GMP phosphodiesterase class II)
MTANTTFRQWCRTPGLVGPGLAVTIAIVYLFLGILWIVESDNLVSTFTTNPVLLTHLQTYKGVGYVAATGALLYLLTLLFWSRETGLRAERERAQTEVIDRLAMAADWRDDETGEHVRRVSEYAYIIAKEYGLCEEECKNLRLAAAMHDIGKIGIDDDLIRFEGKYSFDQRARMQAHTLIGGQILSGGDTPLIRMAHNVAMSHHERWDGKGYPEGLVGEDIPIEARIVAVADVFDAVLSKRRYKQQWPWDAAVMEIEVLSGSAFDPKVVEAFKRAEGLLKKDWEFRRSDAYADHSIRVSDVMDAAHPKLRKNKGLGY